MDNWWKVDQTRRYQVCLHGAYTDREARGMVHTRTRGPRHGAYTDTGPEAWCIHGHGAPRHGAYTDMATEASAD